MAPTSDDVRKPPDADNHPGEYLRMDLDHDYLSCDQALNAFQQFGGDGGGQVSQGPQRLNRGDVDVPYPLHLTPAS